MTLKADRQKIAEQLGLLPEQLPDDLKPRYNIAPTQMHLIVTQEREDRVVEEARWGLINSWAKDAKSAYKTINARAETVDKSPAFRAAFKKRRCLVPVDGFYEWFGPKNDRQPYWFHRPDGSVFCFAGLYELWYPEGQEPQLTFTVITTDANAYTARIHDRMPVILDDEAQDAWLFPGEDDPAKLKQLLVPPPDDALVAKPVSKDVNNARTESPSLLDDIVLDNPAY